MRRAIVPTPANARRRRKLKDSAAVPATEVREDNVAFPRWLVVRTQGSGEIDFGEVQTQDRERSDFVRLSGLLPYGSSGEKGSLGLIFAGGRVTACYSAFGEQIGKVWVLLGAPWRQARGCSAVDVVEDLADQVWIGDIRYDPQLSAAERAKADVYFKDALQSLRPGQRRGGRIVAVAT